MIRAVVFDVGYTLIDEARHWADWARYIGVPESDFMTALRAVIAERRHHREVFQLLRPGFDWAKGVAERDANERDPIWSAIDLYPDVLQALQGLRARGLRVGLAGNQPPQAKAALQAMNLPVDWIANSAEFGVEKPAPAFFANVAARAGVPAQDIAYVGDRLDNDILPAQAAGMRGVFLIRGPWGEAHAKWPEAAHAHMTFGSLRELAARL
jgi:HAD superfamily hydrolase (TIGR01509 family)